MAQNPNSNANKQQEDSLKKIQSLLDQIQRSYNTLGEKSPFSRDAEKAAKGYEDAEKAISGLEEALENVTRRISESNSSAKDLLSTLNSIVKEINPKAVNYTKDFEGGFKKIVNEAKKLQYEEEGINKLSKKELETLEKKILINQSDARAAAERLLAEQNIDQKIDKRTTKYKQLSEDTKVAIAFLNDQNSIIKSINDKIQRRIELEKESNKIGGLAKASFEGLSTALDKLGFSGLSERLGINDAKEKMGELSDKIAKDNQRAIDVENEISSLKRKRPKTAEGKQEIADRLKVLQDEKTTLAASNAQYAGMSGKMAVLKEGIMSMGQSLITNLKDPVSLTLLAVKEVIAALQAGDKATGELAKGFNISYQDALALREELNSVANLSSDINVNTQGLQESMVAVGKQLGSNVMLNQRDLVTFTKLREQAAFTNEELGSMQRLTLATGGTLEDNTGKFLAQAQINSQNKGVVLNTKQLLQETANVSDAIKLTVGGTAEGLGKAAGVAKSLGMNLEQVDKIAGSLLDFESSISSELEAELVTGKNLNLEKARLAALNGDLATVAEEISKQTGSAAEFTKMNRVQQEALAKSVGMNREELAKTLVEREALAGLSGEEAKAGKETFDTLVKQYGVEKAQQMIKEQGFDTLMKQQSVQERFNKSIEKLRDGLMGLVQPILEFIDPLMDIVNDLLPAINLILQPIIMYFKFMLFPIKTMAEMLKDITERVQMLFKGIGQIFNGNFEQGFKSIGNALLGALLSPVTLILRAFQGLVNASIDLINNIPGVDIGKVSWAEDFKKATSIKDGMINSKGGLVVSGEKGTYKLDPEDSVIAGTNLNNPEERINPLGAIGKAIGSLLGGGANIDISPLIQKMDEVNSQLISLNSKSYDVYLDSTKLGTGLAVGTSKVQ